MVDKKVAPRSVIAPPPKSPRNAVKPPRKPVAVKAKPVAEGTKVQPAVTAKPAPKKDDKSASFAEGQ